MKKLECIEKQSYRKIIRTTFGEVSKLEQGLAFNKKNNFLMVDDGIPLLRITDLINNTETKFVDADKVSLKFLSKPTDIIFTRTGQVGLVFKGRIGIVHNNCFRIIPFNGIDPDYMYWFLKQPSVIEHAKNLARGSAQPDLNHDAFKSIPFYYPLIPIQCKIASILSRYDDIIENNRRRIRLLEEAARLLYREWFVRLRFPGFEHTKIVDGIPEGWKSVQLQDIANITMGQSPSSNYYNHDGIGLPFHQGVSDYGDRFPENTTYCSKEFRIAQVGDILFSVRAPVGRINITLDKIVIGRGLASIRSKMNYQEFLFYCLKNIFFKDDLMGTGAIYAAITKKELTEFSLIYPSNSIIQSFVEYVRPIDQMIISLHISIINLVKARDLLLPRLMNGVIPV